jgi:hypothetical protein
MSFDRGWRNTQNLGSLLNRQTAKESQLNNSALLRVKLGEPIQCVIQRDHVDTSVCGNSRSVV